MASPLFSAAQKQVLKEEEISSVFLSLPVIWSEARRQALETRSRRVYLVLKKLSATCEGANQRSVTVEEDDEERDDVLESGRE